MTLREELLLNMTEPSSPMFLRGVIAILREDPIAAAITPRVLIRAIREAEHEIAKRYEVMTDLDGMEEA